VKQKSFRAIEKRIQIASKDIGNKMIEESYYLWDSVLLYQPTVTLIFFESSQKRPLQKTQVKRNLAMRNESLQKRE
jgi:hypothetical protein